MIGMRLSYSLGSLLTIEQVLECSKKLGRLKPDTMWIPETWGMENFSMLSMVSKENTISKIGSSIVNIYSRSPSLIAMGAATVDTISNKRLVLGLGTSSQPLVEDFHGDKFQNPLKRMRECVEIIRLILSGKMINYTGEVFSLKNFSLLIKSPRDTIPIYLAAVNQKMVELTWEIADGVIFYLRPKNEIKSTLTKMQNKKKIDSLSSEKSKIKNEIGLQFVKISRPLNKYVYVSALDKPQKKLLASLIDEPYDVLTEANKNDIAQILESVRKGIESGSISVKDVSKSISQIDETLPKLDNFIKQIITYDKSKNDIEVKLSNFDDEQLRLEESNLARNQQDMLDSESKIKLLDSETTKTVESIPKYIKSIESILNQISAVQYKIKQS